MSIKRKAEYFYIPELYFLTMYTFSRKAPYWEISNYCIRVKALKTKKMYRYTLDNRRHKVSIEPPKKKGEYFIPRTKNLPWKEIE